jgi:hypothetical protein
MSACLAGEDSRQGAALLVRRTICHAIRTVHSPVAGGLPSRTVRKAIEFQEKFAKKAVRLMPARRVCSMRAC